MTRTLAAGLVVAGLLASAGCARRTLHPSFGERYHAYFNAQAAEHEIRPPAPLSGDEARCAMQSYRASLLNDPSGAAASTQAPSSVPGGLNLPALTIGGAGSGGGGAMNFKVR